MHIDSNKLEKLSIYDECLIKELNNSMNYNLLAQKSYNILWFKDNYIVLLALALVFTFINFLHKNNAKLQEKTIELQQNHVNTYSELKAHTNKLEQQIEQLKNKLEILQSNIEHQQNELKDINIHIKQQQLQIKDQQNQITQQQNTILKHQKGLEYALTWV